jgi:hypothetical protein
MTAHDGKLEQTSMGWKVLMLGAAVSEKYVSEACAMMFPSTTDP